LATGFSSAATVVSTLADLYEKANTDVKTGIKLITEEAKWFRQYPKEKITVSGNENRIPLILVQPTGVAMIPDGGNEAVMSTPAPTRGTFMPVQMNARYGFTGLAQALTNRARSAMIEEQVDYQSAMSIAKFGRAIGLQTYGQSTGTVAVVSVTNGAGATQTDIQLKNAFGTTAIPGNTSVVQKTYISSLLRVGEKVALIRAAAIVEFGTVVASPAVSFGVGAVDITFTSSITPTLGDLLVFANADGDSTIAGTDVNNWAIGFAEILFATSLHGVSGAAGQFPAWNPGSAQTSVQRMSFQVKEKMANDIWNAGGVKMDRMIVSQGVRRDAIAGERGARRYDAKDDLDLEGDLGGFQYLTSQLAPPGFAIGWYGKALAKIELSDQPEDGGGKSIFKLDKVQGKSQMAAAYDYFYQKVCSSRAAVGYASNLTES
jgi:hypothetical protein